VEDVVSARVLAVPASGGRVVVVGSSLDDNEEALARLAALLLIGGPVLLGAITLIAWLATGAALRPIESMRAEAAAIGGAVAGRRLPVPDTGDEVARLAATLNGMLDRLETAIERERRFAADASHELRTPLANLRAELELSLRRSRTIDELEATVRSAAEEAERLSRLAEDLLVLARADRGLLPVHPRPTDLGVLVEAAMVELRPRAAERGIEVEASPAPGTRVDLDEARVGQAVRNLLENALRHTPAGGRIGVEVGRANGSVRLEVWDTGAGFPEAFLPHAFEPFTRPDAARARDDGGTGLGLAIVRAVAESHGGSAEAANRPGGGASVVLLLPA
jgi:heavy metal sensor kinase